MESISQRALCDATCPNRFPPPAAVRRASQGNRDRRLSRQANRGQRNEQAGFGGKGIGGKGIGRQVSGGKRIAGRGMYGTRIQAGMPESMRVRLLLSHRNRLPPHSLAQNSLALFPRAPEHVAQLFVSLQPSINRCLGLLRFQGTCQSSIFRAGTRLNSAVVCVTKTSPLARAIAAIIRSFGPIGVPDASNAARSVP